MTPRSKQGDGITTSSASECDKQAQMPSSNGIASWRPSNVGLYRLMGCAVNIAMIVGTYLEYLWAADWAPISAQCDQRSSLPWLDFADCFHRYTYSHSMLRGQNLKLFGVFGSFAAACYLAAEHRRTGKLRRLLEAQVRELAGQSSEVGAARIAGAESALRLLALYSKLMTTAFIGVLFLVPCHLERPLLHYGCAVIGAGSMFYGVCAYFVMPLDRATGLSEAGIETSGCDDIVRWAKRHQRLRRYAALVIALHFVLGASFALHHVAWIDATGRFSGACEVLVILSYQFFVAMLATDDFATRHLDQKANATKEHANVNAAEVKLLSDADASGALGG